MTLGNRLVSINSRLGASSKVSEFDHPAAQSANKLGVNIRISGNTPCEPESPLRSLFFENAPNSQGEKWAP